MKLGICDIESTGLFPHAGHEPWEVALLVVDEDEQVEKYEWQLPVDLSKADPMALTISRFYERRNVMEKLTDPWSFADEFAEITHGIAMVGAVPSFDDSHLKRILLASGACPGWHYQLIDVETLAVGWLQGLAAAHVMMRTAASADLIERAAKFTRPPWDSNELSRAVGVDPDQFDRHTALGDCEWALAIYQSVMR